MRCNRCGNENPASNRFCGMCGATLLAAPAPTPAGSAASAPQPPVAVAPPAREVPRPAPPPEPRPAAPQHDPEPAGISGPSFLGLNQPARGRDSDSRNLDYLLHDEEESSGGGAGKIMLIFVALVLVVGLGYLRWRNGGIPGLSSLGKKPAAAQPADASQPPASDAGSQPAIQPANPSTPAASSTQPSASTTPPAATPENSEPPVASTVAPASQPAAKPENSTKTPDSAASSAEGNDPGDEEPEKPAPVAKPKPTEKPAPSRPLDRIAEAEKYIYGKGGVQQDCDRGLKILRPAAEQSNPKAMVSLGALYSAGLCTPRDLPTAYRWFALALRKEPENEAVQNDLKKLWSEMTQPERNLAIKLSQ